MSTNGKTKTNAATPFIKTGGGTDCTAIKARVDSVDWTKIEPISIPRGGPLYRSS